MQTTQFLKPEASIELCLEKSYSKKCPISLFSLNQVKSNTATILPGWM